MSDEVYKTIVPVVKRHFRIVILTMLNKGVTYSYILYEESRKHAHIQEIGGYNMFLQMNKTVS